MRTGGSYVKDPKTQKVELVEKPTRHSPDGDGARDRDGTLIGNLRLVGERGPELEASVPAADLSAKPKGKAVSATPTTEE